MREILFRGKRVDTGQWLYGHYVCQYGADMIYLPEGVDREQGFDYYHIDKETLCEFTGLRDKNGKRIWENDIVITQPFYDRPYSDKRKPKQFFGIVEYKTSTFNGNKFYPKQVYQAEWGLKYTEEHGKFVHFSWGDLWGCEVIGNRFDNPELLKAERR